MTYQELPVPSFFNPANAGEWSYAPNHMTLLDEAKSWVKQHGIKPSGSDKFNLHLLLIDEQKDFCLPQGTLYVGGRSGRGAIDDSVRTVDFIYRNLGLITNITTTLDTHFAYQIFTQSFWQDQEGQPIAPFTLITTDDVLSGKVKPNPVMASWLCNGNYGWLMQQVRHYCQELERTGKYVLIAWTPHCILGSDGHALVGVIQEARMFQSYTRGAQSHCEVKGGHPLTENYSVLSPEVRTRFDGKALAQKNTSFVKTLLDADAMVIAGQADSHCVASSIDDLLTEIVSQDPDLARKVYIMTDCMSSVVTPVMDFTDNATAAHDRFSNAGMHIVKSTDPVASWPGIKL